MLKISCLILSLSLTACTHQPIQFVYIQDLKAGLCNKWKVPDTIDGKFIFVSSMPSSQCDGYISINPSDLGPAKDWYSSHCK
jgi:hypothetical protein